MTDMEPIPNQIPGGGLEKLPLNSPESFDLGNKLEKAELADTIEANKEDLRSQYDIAKAVAGQISGPGLPTIMPKVSETAQSKPQIPKVATPLTASDDDRLPDEWIEAAKRIVESTIDDPARRDDEVAELRVDYRMKRYGPDRPPGTDN